MSYVIEFDTESYRNEPVGAIAGIEDSNIAVVSLDEKDDDPDRALTDEDKGKRLRSLSWLLSLQDTLLRPILEGLQLPLLESDDDNCTPAKDATAPLVSDIDLESATQIPRWTPPTNVDDPSLAKDHIVYSPRNADNV